MSSFWCIVVLGLAVCLVMIGQKREQIERISFRFIKMNEIEITVSEVWANFAMIIDSQNQTNTMAIRWYLGAILASLLFRLLVSSQSVVSG